MHVPKLRPQMGACEINKGGRHNDEGTSCFSTLRCWLIVWACMRLVVSVFWTSIIVLKTVGDFLHEDPVYVNSIDDPYLAFGVIATLAQLVEFGMLVTFIVAGVKKSANLYRAYYRYCILTLVIYIVAITLCLFLGYQRGHYFAEIYFTYHFNDFSTQIMENDDIVFAVAAALDICLEVLLIYSVKSLIKKYQYNQSYVASENV